MESRNGNGYITAKEISSKFNIPYSKINHYTDLGLFSIVRKEGNKRIYHLDEVEMRYQAIAKLVNEGYPLGLIRKKMLALTHHELL